MQCNGDETMALHTTNTAYNKLQPYQKATYYTFIVC